MLAFIFKFHLNCSRTICFRSLFCYSTTSPALQLQKSGFLADYLMNSLGFSKDEAISASGKAIPRLKTFKKDPDLVVNYFENLGLGKAQIKTVVSVAPNLLYCKVDKTLKPKIKFLQDLGFSGPDLVKVIMGSKCILLRRGLDSCVRPRVEFLRQLLGNDDKILRTLKKLPFLLGCNNTKTIEDNVQWMRSNGFSQDDVAKFIARHPRLVLGANPEWFQKRLDSMETDLGITSDSRMFFYGFEAACGCQKSAINSKLDILKSFGFSDEDIGRALRRNPFMVNYSEARLRKHLDFLVKGLGYTPHYLSDRHLFFNLSLEKRLKPRYEVLNSLTEQKLNKRKASFYTVVCMNEQKFIKEYLVPYKRKIPDVYRSYLERTKNEEIEQLRSA